jgi:hypothetical protein
MLVMLPLIWVWICKHLYANSALYNIYTGRRIRFRLDHKLFYILQTQFVLFEMFVQVSGIYNTTLSATETVFKIIL